MTMAGPLQAFLFGLLSAASLPIGAVLGLLFSPVPPRFVALCMAFGSGALVYAVATDLFGAAIHRLQDASSPDERNLAASVLFAETVSGVFGALLYLWLNRLLEEPDAVCSETHQASLQPVPAASCLQPVPAAHSHDINQIAEGLNRPAAGVNATWTAARDLSFSGALMTLPSSFPARPHQAGNRPDASFRMSARERLLQASLLSPVPVASFHHEVRVVSNRAKNVAMSMWLGVTLDGIPESIMMGFMAKRQRLTKVLVVSIFIANFPEAFSAASMLKGHGMESWKILLMWCSIFINTGLLALLGLEMMPSDLKDLSPEYKAMDIITGVMEGITGGAMMAMTSTAMLPEAFHGAGTWSGLLFVGGFLVAVAIEGCGELLSLS